MKKIRFAVIIFLIIFLVRGFSIHRNRISSEISLKDSENFTRGEDLSDKIKIIKEKAKKDEGYEFVYENIDKLPDKMIKLAAKKGRGTGFYTWILKR